MLHGIRLEILFYELMLQLSRQVIYKDERYNKVDEATSFIVNEIEIKKLQE